MIDYLKNNKLEGMSKIVYKYKQKIEEEQNSCGILYISNLRIAPKIKMNNPSNATIFYLCNRNLEELKELDTDLTNYFDSQMNTSPSLE